MVYYIIYDVHFQCFVYFHSDEKIDCGEECGRRHDDDGDDDADGDDNHCYFFYFFMLLTLVRKVL